MKRKKSNLFLGIILRYTKSTVVYYIIDFCGGEKKRKEPFRRINCLEDFDVSMREMREATRKKQRREKMRRFVMLFQLDLLEMVKFCEILFAKLFLDIFYKVVR